MRTRLSAALLTLAALLTPPAAPAQVDPDPDGIGIYLDQAATVTSLDVPAAPGAPVGLSAWLVATRVSLPGDILYYEGRVEWCCADAQVQIVTVAGWDQCWEMPGSITSDGICAYAEPGELPLGDLVVLKRYDITLRSTEPPLAFRLGPFRLWTAPGVFVDLHPAGGDWDLPVAVINGQAPVAVASATWSAVKALYR